jgi:hypothetical protein
MQSQLRLKSIPDVVNDVGNQHTPNLDGFGKNTPIMLWPFPCTFVVSLLCLMPSSLKNDSATASPNLSSSATPKPNSSNVGTCFAPTNFSSFSASFTTNKYSSF